MAEEETDKVEGIVEADDSDNDKSLELSELDNEPVDKVAEKGPKPPAQDESGKGTPQGLEAVYDIPVKVSAILGRSTMQVNEILKLGRGAVVELDRNVGEAIDIYVNNRLVARGEIVVIDERLGVTMTEIIKTERR